MALGATVYRIRIALSDTDRGVYESLDLRIARHPSESMRYLVARTLGYALFYEEGIAFSRGLSTTDEPAVWLRHGDGRIRLWLDIGNPSAERLHRASKASERVVVVTYDAVERLRSALGKERIHRADRLELVGIPTSFMDALGDVTGRDAAWDVSHSGGELYVDASGKSFHAPIERGFLAESSD